MICVVFGPIYTKFARPVVNMIARGVRTCVLDDKSNTPDIEEGIRPIAVRSPGKVRARMTGSAVCMEKYIGNSADWRVANCGRGRTLYAVTPAMKDWKTSVPRRVP